MYWYVIIFALFMVFGLINTMYQMYRMIELDAKCRGYKSPKAMGFLAISGQRGEGLLLYLLGRRKYPPTMTEEDKNKMKSIKYKCILSMVFLALGAVCLIIILLV